MKAPRHEAILKLVSEEAVQTQEELITRLGEMGYSVTQATISRDIRELKLTKVLTGQGTYRYVVPSNSDGKTVSKINSSLLDAVTKIDYANNIIVITTYPGMAQAVGAGIDSANIPDILGCVGGDDTIMVVTRSEDAASGFYEAFKKLKFPS